MSRIAFARRAALLALLAFAAQPANAENWTRYENGRFGTVVEVPADAFPGRRPEPENGDGATFLSADDTASLAVWGSYAQEGETPADLLAFASETPGLARAEELADGYMLSGAAEGTAYFESCRIGPGADRITHCVRLEYPQAGRAAYDPLITRIAASLGGP